MDPSLAGTDLVSAAFQLTLPLTAKAVLFLGAYRDESGPPFRDWHWVDGTSSTSITCTTSAGCGMWGPGEPR